MVVRCVCVCGDGGGGGGCDGCVCDEDQIALGNAALARSKQAAARAKRHSDALHAELNTLEEESRA